MIPQLLQGGGLRAAQGVTLQESCTSRLLRKQTRLALMAALCM